MGIETVPHRGEMRRAAEISGGKFFSLDNADRITAELPPGRQPVEQGLDVLGQRHAGFEQDLRAFAQSV